MNRFVDQCRSEWKRLRVPDQIADEMKAELAADLDEAQAEGDSLENVLGSDATDPRSFAASWARERGVVPARRMTALLPASIASLAIAAAVGAGLLIFASPDVSSPATAPLVISLPSDVAAAASAAAWVASDAPPPPAIQTQARAVEAELARANAHLMMQEAEREDARSGVELHRTGSILLVVGILGILLVLPVLFWKIRTAHL